MSVPSAQLPLPPLDTAQTGRIDEALHGLSADQLHWVSGYAAGLAANNAPAQAVASADPANTLTILYGSQTGNGEGVARQLEAEARARGFAVRLISLADFKPARLKREKLVTFVISTHGEGDPPDDAELFQEFLLSKKAPKLDGLKYSVLALGDSSYVNFCQTGREFDTRLAELGASRFSPVVECDLDYEDDASAWTSKVLEALPGLIDAGEGKPQLRAVETTGVFNKHKPFRAEVLVNQKITGGDSSKDVRHIELSLEGSGLHYQPGDSLAVVAANPPNLVAELLAELGLDPDARVTVGEDKLRLEDGLLEKLEITQLALPFLRQWAELSKSKSLADMLQPEAQAALSGFIDSHQVIDVLRQFPASVDAQGFADSLRKLSPRSYSIASSEAANPDEVHLTVAAVRYEAFGSEHWGAASTYLADRLDEGEQVRVFVEENRRFRLPAASDSDVIMIGPGTGVAPFRAFVEERAETAAAGRNWLFFGDRNFSSDFLYQLEWQRHLKQGNLDRLDVAFSRDQANKIYVQDRIRENGADLYAWLDGGAHIYVCGDAKQMAGDVDAALADVLVEHGGFSPDDAKSRLKDLRREGRYQRDVY